MKHTYTFYATDNGGGRHTIKVKAVDKQEAIKEGFRKIERKLKGSIIKWECKLAL